LELSPHVDRPARDLGAELVHRYLGGQISGGDLHKGWPSSDKDAALYAIGREILPQVRGAKLPDEYTDEHRQQIRTILERCELFLTTELPYGWGNLGLGSCITYGCAVVVLIVATGTIFAVLGWSYVGFALLVLTMIVAFLSIPARGVSSKENWEKVQAMIDGDLKHWPFESEEDLLAVREGKDPMEAAGAETLGPWDQDLLE